MGTGGRLHEVACGNLDILLLHRIRDVEGRQLARRHLVRVKPDPQTVVLLAEHRHVADAGDLGQLVFDIDRGVIAQVELILGVVRRKEVHDQQDARRFLLHGHARLLDHIGQRGHGQVYPVLHLHLGVVQIGTQIERDGQRVHAVIGAPRRHVEHFFDADDLLLDGSSYRVGHHLGVGPGIGAGDIDRWRSDVGILGDRQRGDGDRSAQDDHDRDDDRKDRPVDEKLRYAGHNMVLGGDRNKKEPIS